MISQEKDDADGKTLKDYMRHVEQVSWSQNTHSCDSCYDLQKSCITCEYTKRYKTFVLMFMYCIATIWIALGRV